MFHSQKVTALVPIKDHSERVSRKNFRSFCGKPLYHHILHCLDQTYAIDEIVINTDSAEIILEAPKLSPKIKVHERPEELRGDCVSTNKLFAYDLEHTDADLYVQTHVTNPLLKPETIARAIRTFLENEEKCDSLFSVNEWHTRFYDAQGRALNHDPQVLLRTQDLPPVYEENSCLYIFRKAVFAQQQRRIGEHPYLLPIDRIEASDIDDEYSFRLAELLALYAGGK